MSQDITIGAIDSQVLCYSVLDQYESKQLFAIYAVRQTQTGSKQLAVLTAKVDEDVTSDPVGYKSYPLDNCSGNQISTSESVVVLACLSQNVISIKKRQSGETIYDKLFLTSGVYGEDLRLISMENGL